MKRFMPCRNLLLILSYIQNEHFSSSKTLLMHIFKFHLRSTVLYCCQVYQYTLLINRKIESNLSYIAPTELIQPYDSYLCL